MLSSLRKLMEMPAPHLVMRHNEKRMLQEGVEALWSKTAARGRVLRSANNRALGSLSDTLKNRAAYVRTSSASASTIPAVQVIVSVGPEEQAAPVPVFPEGSTGANQAPSSITGSSRPTPPPP